MADISRRSIAKGTAWSVPTIAIAGNSPAVAASANTVVVNDCGTLASLMILQGGSTPPRMTVRAVSGGSTNFTISMGIWKVDGSKRYVTSTGEQITGFYMFAGRQTTDCTQNTTPSPSFGHITSANGTTGYSATVSLQTPTGCSPMTAGAGLSMDYTLKTNIPYYSSGDPCQVGSQGARAGALGCISVPYSIIPLNALNAIPAALEGCVANGFYFNACFDPTGCIGTQNVLSYSFNTTALH